MGVWLPVVLAIFCGAVFAEEIPSAERPIDHFESRGRSRLDNLAKAGALTGASLLIEAGEMRFLQQPISISADHTTLRSLIEMILKGREGYAVQQKEKLLIVRPVRPAKPLNRVLRLPLGPFSFTEKSVSSLSPRLGFEIRRATGCSPQGFMYAGPPMDLGIPPINLENADSRRLLPLWHPRLSRACGL